MNACMNKGVMNEQANVKMNKLTNQEKNERINHQTKKKKK